MNERRLTIRLLQHWEAIRAEEGLPPLDAFEIADMDDIWPYCFVVRVEDERGQLICERMGRHIADICGRDLTQQPIGQQPETFPDEVLLNNLEEVRAAMSPIEGAGQFRAANGERLRWRACFMPFGSGDQITHILAAFSFKQI